jgi:hypothetical protein
MPRPWTVTPHRPLEKLEDNLWALDADMPGKAPFNRRMAIARLADGRLVFFNAIPMDDATLAEVRAWGTPAFLVIPHGFHKIDAHAFREKLGVKVVAPREAQKRVQAVVQLDGDLDLLPSDPSLTIERVGGSKGEALMLVRSGGGARTSVVFCDLYMHMQGKMPFVPRVIFGFGSEPQIAPRMWRWMFMKDRAAVRAYVDQLASLPGLVRLVPSHGAIVDREPAALLRRLNASV